MTWAITDTNKLDMRVQAWHTRGQEVVYKRRTSRSNNFKTGSTGQGYTDTTVDKCLIGTLSHEDLESLGGDHKVGDRVFRFLSPGACDTIPWNKLPETPPSRSAQIVYNGITYEVYDWATSPDGIVYVVFGRPQ